MVFLLLLYELFLLSCTNGRIYTIIATVGTKGGDNFDNNDMYAKIHGNISTTNISIFGNAYTQWFATGPYSDTGETYLFSRDLNDVGYPIGVILGTDIDNDLVLSSLSTIVDNNNNTKITYNKNDIDFKAGKNDCIIAIINFILQTFTTETSDKCEPGYNFPPPTNEPTQLPTQSPTPSPTPPPTKSPSPTMNPNSPTNNIIVTTMNPAINVKFNNTQNMNISQDDSIQDLSSNGFDANNDDDVAGLVVGIIFGILALIGVLFVSHLYWKQKQSADTIKRYNNSSIRNNVHNILTNGSQTNNNNNNNIVKNNNNNNKPPPVPMDALPSGVVATNDDDEEDDILDDEAIAMHDAYLSNLQSPSVVLREVESDNNSSITKNNDVNVSSIVTPGADQPPNYP